MRGEIVAPDTIHARPFTPAYQDGAIDPSPETARHWNDRLPADFNVL